MKLKEAKQIAIKAGFNYIAVDKDVFIYMFKEKPELFDILWDTTSEYEHIGVYTGKKDWKDTLRSCHVEVELPESWGEIYDPEPDPTFLKDWDAYADMLQEEVKEEVISEGNGGSTPKQYGLPEGCKELQDLIEYRAMEFAVANIFKSCYRLGVKNTRMYELRKMNYFIDRLIRVENLKQSGE